MKIFAHIFTLSLALQGASASPWFSDNTNDGGVLLESRANNKGATYQQVLAASLKKYPGMKAADMSGKFRYNLNACNAKCENKNEVKDKDGNCKACPKGQKPDKDQTKCVSNGGKEQGKCEDGKVLDPAAGGQDANTDSPKCVSDDDSKCPEGQKAESRKKGSTVDDSSYEPYCAVDDDPDFKCDDSNTYDYKTVKSDKISHSCRSTQKHEEDKKSKYDERVNESKNNKGGNTGDLDKQRRQKNRSGWCFVAVAGMGLFDYMGEEVNVLSDEEIDGLYAHFPEDAPDPFGDGSIPNYVVSKSLNGIAFIGDLETAGFGSIFKAIAKLVGAGKGSTATSTPVKNIRAGSPKGPSSAAKQAGSKSATVKKIMKDDNMLDCVMSGALLAAGGVSRREDEVLTLQRMPLILTIDWSRTEEMSKPAPEGVEIMFRYDDVEDRHYRAAATSQDTYHIKNRLSYESCMTPLLNDAIVSLFVEGGCCAFYDGGSCEGDTFMFTMFNREHGDLQGDHRSSISSYWCTANEDCGGRP